MYENVSEHRLNTMNFYYKLTNMKNVANEFKYVAIDQNPNQLKIKD